MSVCMGSVCVYIVCTCVFGGVGVHGLFVYPQIWISDYLIKYYSKPSDKRPPKEEKKKKKRCFISGAVFGEGFKYVEF